MASHRRTSHLWGILGLIVVLLVALYFVQRLECAPADAAITEEDQARAAGDLPDAAVPHDETPEQALERIIRDRLIINAHEHIQDIRHATRLLPIMDELGIRKTILVGSSRFTITLRERAGFTQYDENNAEILRAVEEYPGRFEAYPTIDPRDPDKLDKLQAMHRRGATGLKLYLGHGYVRQDTGEYMFHVMALDDPEMLPVYEYCERHFIPICFHVQPHAPGFAQQFIEVLTRFPDLKVNAPHFMLSSIEDSRLREFLDTFPNLHADISFGHDDFLRTGLTNISRNPRKFRELFETYPDRFFFGSDLVFTEGPGKTAQWYGDRTQAYYDMLSKREYTTPVLPGRTLRGLELSGPLLDNVLYRNYERFKASQPQGTEITREINWQRMRVPRLDREPGQTFPPRTRR